MEIDRDLAPEVVRAARAFPAVLVTGPRPGRQDHAAARGLWGPVPTFSKTPTWSPASKPIRAASWTAGTAAGDPRRDPERGPGELLAYIRSRIDAAPRRKGQWLLTGSQEAPLDAGRVSESMAGRVAILQLLPFSTLRVNRVTPLTGGYPKSSRGRARAPCGSPRSLQTYLERDVRAVTAIRETWPRSAAFSAWWRRGPGADAQPIGTSRRRSA